MTKNLKVMFAKENAQFLDWAIPQMAQVLLHLLASDRVFFNASLDLPEP
jgi:hypothetical protein